MRVCGAWLDAPTNTQTFTHTRRKKLKREKKNAKQRESFAHTHRKISYALACAQMPWNGIAMNWNTYGKRTIYTPHLLVSDLSLAARLVLSHCVIRILHLIPSYRSLLSFLFCSFFSCWFCVSRGSTNVVFAIFGAFSTRWAHTFHVVDGRRIERTKHTN